MVCGGCGATIADKAIVCYRCGTPTAVPATPVQKGTGARPRHLLWPILLVMIAAACLYEAATAIHGSTAHYVWATAGLVALVAAAVTFVR